MPLVTLYFKEIDFPKAFAFSGQDPVNRALIHQNQELSLRGGLPEDVLPKHVSGGIPIQRYLQGLLDHVPQVQHEDQFSLVSRENAAVNNSVASSLSLNSADMSAHHRDAFVNEFMQWANNHVRVKVRIHGAERSFYVWQSFLDPPAEADALSNADPDSRDLDSDEVDSLERNIPLESLSNEESAHEVPVNDPTPREMFQRYCI